MHNTFQTDQHIRSLDIGGNSLNERTIGYIFQLVNKNKFIRELTISDNNLTRSSLQVIVDCIANNGSLDKLDISGNNINDEFGPILCELMEKANDLNTLILHHNKLEDKAGVHIGEALKNNKNLEYVDLSWNHLRGRGAEHIATGMVHNKTLEHLNLAWNGFGFEGSVAVAYMLAQNTTLKELDLSNNRISPHGLLELLKGLEKNKSLHSLRMGHNPIPAMYTSAMISKIKSAPHMSLQLLDISGIVVDKEFESVVEELQAQRNIDVIYDHSLPVHKQRWEELEKFDPKGVFNIDPVRVLYHTKREMRAIDMFNKIDINHDSKLSRKELDDSLRREGLPLSSSALDQLFDFLDTDKDGQINLREFIQGERRFKRDRIEKAKKALERENSSEVLDIVIQHFSKTFRPDMADVKLPPVNQSQREKKRSSVTQPPVSLSINKTK